MKKIALCISGHTRNYIDLLPEFYTFHRYLSQIGFVDTFIATWDQRNTNFSWSAAHGDIDTSKSSNVITADELISNFRIKDNNITIFNHRFFESQYSPLRYKLFTNNLYNWDSRGIYNNIIHSTKMLFLIYEANLLKCQQEFKNNTKYDIVIRTRPDILYKDNLYKTIPFNNMLDNYLYLVKKNNNTYDDRFAFGSSEIMNQYSSAIYRISSIYDQNIFGDPETVFYSSIKSLISLDKIYSICNPGLLVSESTGGFR